MNLQGELQFTEKRIHNNVFKILVPSQNRNISLSTFLVEFDVQVTVRRDNSYNKPNVLNSQIYFWNKILHFSDSSTDHHQEFFNVHTGMVYTIQFC